MGVQKTTSRVRSDGWTDARRTEFLGALRATGTVGDACAWAGMSSAGAYKLARRDAGFAAAWRAALDARDADRFAAQPARPAVMSTDTLIRRLNTASARLSSRPRGVVAQQKARWA